MPVSPVNNSGGSRREAVSSAQQHPDLLVEGNDPRASTKELDQVTHAVCHQDPAGTVGERAQVG